VVTEEGEAGQRAELRARPTVKTVAALAGVSITTVSRVLNGKFDTLPAATRQRVVDAARELDYRPNSIAVGLRNRQTKTIGLMIPDIGNAYFHQLARGAEDEAVSLGYNVIFCNTDRRPDKEVMAIDLLSDKQVDGIIFTGGGLDDDTHVSDHLRAGANVVTVGPHRLPFPSIGVNDQAAIADAVGHLASQGCTRIACIGGHPGWLIHEERAHGYLRGLEEAGLPFDDALLWPSDMTVRAGSEIIERAVAEGLEFDGLVAFSDYAALSAMRTLRNHGRDVPRDVAVVGCDDIVFSTLVEPSMSSIAFPVLEMGAQATRMLVAMAEKKPVEQRVEFPFELHVRDSSSRTARA
jgi:LacI family transcriptional regulator